MYFRILNSQCLATVISLCSGHVTNNPQILVACLSHCGATGQLCWGCWSPGPQAGLSLWAGQQPSGHALCMVCPAAPKAHQPPTPALHQQKQAQHEEWRAPTHSRDCRSPGRETKQGPSQLTFPHTSKEQGWKGRLRQGQVCVCLLSMRDTKADAC